MRKALYILADLHDEDMIWIAAHAVARGLAPGETLIQAGVAPSHLYFVVGGALEVIGPGGARLAELGLGDVVGEMSFVEKRLPSASVRAAGPAKVIGVARETLLRAFAEDPAFGMRFYRALAVFLSDRLRTMSDGAGAELDEGLLDTLTQAGERFIRLTASEIAGA